MTTVLTLAILSLSTAMLSFVVLRLNKAVNDIEYRLCKHMLHQEKMVADLRTDLNSINKRLGCNAPLKNFIKKYKGYRLSPNAKMVGWVDRDGAAASDSINFKLWYLNECVANLHGRVVGLWAKKRNKSVAKI